MIFLLLFLAAGLIWLLQSILYEKWWEKGLRVTIEFCQKTAVEGETAALTEIITNEKYLPLPVLHVKFQIGRALVFLKQSNSQITDQNYRSDIFSCMPWQQIRRRLEFRCGKRGFYPIRQADLVSYDLLWSHPRVTARLQDTALIVYPSFTDVPRLSLPLRHLTGALATRQALLRDPFELQSIRPYTPEDSYRDINWKATARTGSLKVNVHAPAAFRQVTLLLDGAGNRLWEDLELKEEAIRICATLADQLIAQGIPVAVRTNGKDSQTGTIPRLEAGAGRDHLRSVLELLARLDLSDPKRPSMEEMIGELLERSHPSAGGPAASNGAGLYALISLSQKPSLARAFHLLSRESPGSLWILPLRPGETCEFALQFPDIELTLWEVPYAQTKTD